MNNEKISRCNCDSGDTVYNSTDKLNDDLFMAARAGNKHAIEKLISEGADANAKDEDGWSALMCAVYHGHEECFIEMMKDSLNINADDRDQ